MKAALYARVSSERQAEKDLSIPAQMKALRDYAIRNKWEVVNEFVDEAESARTANRPAFQEMINLTKQKPSPFKVILVWKLSRFARNREDSILYKSALRKRGVQIVSINEQIDETPTGRLLEGLIETIDEFYSANLAQDTRRGMKENAQRGCLNGSRIPYGYRAAISEINGVSKRVLVVNEDEARGVKRVFELSLSGEGAKDIAQTLTSEGFPTRNGKPWNKKFVAYVLQNESYTGTYIWNRTGQKDGIKIKNSAADIVRIENHHAALIDPESFAKCHRMIKERTPARNHPRAVSSQHALSGLVYCGCCGSRMTISTAKSGRFFYYSCKRKLNEGNKSCNQRSISTKKLEPSVFDTIKHRLLSEEHLSRLFKLVESELKNSQSDATELVANLSIQLSANEKKIRRYFDLIETEGVPFGNVATRLNELNEEKRVLVSQKEKLQNSVRYQNEPAPSADAIKACVQDLRGILSRGTVMQRKSFLRSFVRRIGVRDNEAEIEYSSPLLCGQSENSEVLPIGRNGDPTGNRTR